MHHAKRLIPVGASTLWRVEKDLHRPVLLAPEVLGCERAYPESKTYCLLISATGRTDSGTSEVRTRHMCARRVLG